MKTITDNNSNPTEINIYLSLMLANKEQKIKIYLSLKDSEKDSGKQTMKVPFIVIGITHSPDDVQEIELLLEYKGNRREITKFLDGSKWIIAKYNFENQTGEWRLASQGSFY